MAKGLDANTDCSGLIPCLKQHGYEFIARYYGRTKHHPLTQHEAKTISAAGMRVVAVWESGSPTSAHYFSHAQGIADGHDAYLYAHTVIGQPTDAPIYFAVDYDATHADVNGVVTSYFQGVHEGFDRARGSAPAYPVGVYGSGLTCAHLLGARMVAFTWLSESTGFAGSATFTDWNIKQHVSPASICGLSTEDTDTDETQGNGGGFQIH